MNPTIVDELILLRKENHALRDLIRIERKEYVRLKMKVIGLEMLGMIAPDAETLIISPESYLTEVVR